jgi:uncharacterized protein (UPF0333 family)
MKRNGQIAIEFLLLIAMAFAIIITLLISILSMSESNTKMKAYREIDDLGKALQQEFLLAVQLEDGYNRKLNLPLTANGESYNAIIGSSNYANATHSYLLLTYKSTELLYLIPPIIGNIRLGDNILVKDNGTIRIN